MSLDNDRFLTRTMEEYLGNPFAATPEAGKQMVITSDSPPWLHCHHEIFPANWQCKACPPNRCFNGRDLKALYQSSRDYQSSCSRQGCAASVTSETVLVNTQKESIMTLGGENLMPSRFEASFMWCCECGGLRQAGRNQSGPCSHCVDFQESDCGECLWCNKFLEPTEFPNGDIVQWGVLHLHSRALAIKEGREVPDFLHRTPSQFGKEGYQACQDSVKGCWVVMVSSFLLGSLFLKCGFPQLLSTTGFDCQGSSTNTLP
jgi:hypothetical protein